MASNSWVDLSCMNMAFSDGTSRDCDACELPEVLRPFLLLCMLFMRILGGLDPRNFTMQKFHICTLWYRRLDFLLPGGVPGIHPTAASSWNGTARPS